MTCFFGISLHVFPDLSLKQSQLSNIVFFQSGVERGHVDVSVRRELSIFYGAALLRTSVSN